MRALVTGGTGFIGSWIVDALRPLMEVEIYTRHTKPLLDYKGITHLVHAAYTSNMAQTPESSLRELDSLDLLTEQLFWQHWPLEKVLVISSAAVYDKPGPYQEDLVPITCRSTYSTGKRVSELRAFLHGTQGGATVTSARLGAFLGPRLPLNRGFAAADFIEAAKAGRKIQIKGDGSPIRTYQYPSDMAAWCLKILLEGQHGQAYNVGGDEPVTLLELAVRINQIAGGPGVEILGAPVKKVDQYTPNVRKAKELLGLTNMPLNEAIGRTLHA